jgi:hypothetical protein
MRRIPADSPRPARRLRLAAGTAFWARRVAEDTVVFASASFELAPTCSAAMCSRDRGMRERYVPVAFLRVDGARPIFLSLFAGYLWRLTVIKIARSQ